MIFLKKEPVVIHCVYFVGNMMKQFHISLWTVIGQSMYDLLPF